MRWIIRFVVSLFVVVALVVVGLLLVPGDRIARLAKEQFESATGRGIEIESDVRAMIWPVLGVRVGSVEVANAPWSDAGPMIRAKGLRIGVSPLALFRGEIEITRVELTEPEVLLEVSADGQENWAFEGVATGVAAQGTIAGDGAIPAFTLGKGVITGGTVRWLDHQSGTDLKLDTVNATLKLPLFDGAGDLQLEAGINGVPQVLDAQITNFGSFLNGGVSGLVVALNTGGSKVGFAGRGSWQPMALEGRLEADLDDMPSVYKTAGQPVAAVPAGFGQKIGLSALMTVTPDSSLHLREAKIALDHNDLSGEADIGFGSDRPQIRARFSAGSLDFSALAASEQEDAEAAPGGGAENTGGWSRDPIDAAFLSLVDGEVAFDAENIDLGTLKLGPTRAVATVDRSRAVFELREIVAYEGQVTGRFVMNNRNGLSVGGNLDFAGVSLQPALTDLAGYERLIGIADFQMQFLGVGNTMHDIMNSLSGEGAFAIGAGELRGLDLVGMLRNLDMAFEGEGQKTIFDSVSGSFTIADGVLHNDDLLFVASLARADGAGEVGIGTRTFDYLITPRTFAAEDNTGGISVPVRISGTWEDPKFRPDLAALAEQDLAEEREALEARVQEALEQELGVEVEEGESVEDAIRRQLEEEAKDALLNLLGGSD